MGQLENVEKIATQSVHEKTWFERFRSNSKQYGVGAAILGTTAVATTSANAADGLAASILEAVTGEVTAIANSQKAIYGLLIVVLVGFLIWRYSKRTVNSG
ncbi:hypothetical protein [Acinetobacter bereziniae]|uniref:hypothetical protein n=1 Tax=Acinetobacter bereziniae TaxID=106648 RepID=UPI001901190F|nr:hypothetical protein [Acinetobacter bereziniae]MBJ8445670.1 hypothetical protein [Acinetobacter bereziniae]